MCYATEDGYKRCSRCKRNLPVACYYRNRSRKDGYQPECRDCRREIGIRPPDGLDCFKFERDWKTMSVRELAKQHNRSEASVRLWAQWLRRCGRNLPRKKCIPYDKQEFVRCAQTMSGKKLAERFGLSEGGVSSRKTSLRRKGYAFPTDDHVGIGNKSHLGERQYDRHRFIQRVARYRIGIVAELEGITEQAVHTRIKRLKKEGIDAHRLRSIS